MDKVCLIKTSPCGPCHRQDVRFWLRRYLGSSKEFTFGPPLTHFPGRGKGERGKGKEERGRGKTENGALSRLNDASLVQDSSITEEYGPFLST